MRQIDDIVRQSLQIEPITVIQAHTLFEDSQPALIQSEWYFTSPYANKVRSVTIDVQRLLKYYDLTPLKNGDQTDSLLGRFTNDLNLYRSRCHDANQLSDVKESDLLRYLNFIDVLSQTFENNVTSFVYQVGNDTFRFELLNTLLTLLAYYNTQALSIHVEQESEPLKRKELSRAKARLFLLCSEVLKEIDIKCKVLQPEEGRMIVYLAAPRSLSMDPVKGIIVATDDTSSNGIEAIELHTFIDSMMGGEKSRLARLELCVAKKHEALYDVVTCGQSLKQDIDGKLRVNLMGRIFLIHQAYLKVVNYTKDSLLNEALYRHARFMAHYWLYKAHYTLARHDAQSLLPILIEDIENDEELEKAQEVLARLMFITKEAIAMEKHVDIMTRLAPSLEVQYSIMTQEIAILSEQFDKEIYIKRSTHEKDMPLELQAIQEHPTQQNLFTEARTEAFKEYYQLNPSFTQCRALLRSLTERLKQPTHAKELLARSGIKKQTSTFTTTTPVSIKMTKETKLAVLNERLTWVNLFIENFNQSDHAFVFNTDLYDKFKQELQEIQKTIEQVSNRQ